MPTVAEVVRRYGPAYLERFGDTHARGAQEGAARHRRLSDRRAGDGALPLRGLRADPLHGPVVRRPALSECQRDKAEAWLATQVDRLLPCPYFLVTFTLPAGLWEVARGHQRAVYSALFRASSEALRAWRPIPGMSAPIDWASSACCTPGAGRWSITPMSITWSPAAA